MVKKRHVFSTLIELVNYLKVNWEIEAKSKKVPYKVTLPNGIIKYILANNSDHAIAGIIREDELVHVETVPLHNYIDQLVD